MAPDIHVDRTKPFTNIVAPNLDMTVQTQTIWFSDYGDVSTLERNEDENLIS